jgi:hypothetical protein
VKVSMRFRYMSARRSNGSPVSIQFQYPIHQLPLSQDSQDEIAFARTLLCTHPRKAATSSPCGAARRQRAQKPR